MLLRVTSAMATGVTDRLWSMPELVERTPNSGHYRRPFSWRRLGQRRAAPAIDGGADRQERGAAAAAAPRGDSDRGGPGGPERGEKGMGSSCGSGGAGRPGPTRRPTRRSCATRSSRASPRAGSRAFRGIQLLRRDEGGKAEFMTVMRFDGLKDVRDFAGQNYEVPGGPAPGRARCWRAATSGRCVTASSRRARRRRADAPRRPGSDHRASAAGIAGGDPVDRAGASRSAAGMVGSAPGAGLRPLGRDRVDRVVPGAVGPVDLPAADPVSGEERRLARRRAARRESSARASRVSAWTQSCGCARSAGGTGGAPTEDRRRGSGPCPAAARRRGPGGRRWAVRPHRPSRARARIRRWMVSVSWP